MKWVKHQLTPEQAEALYDTGIWLHWTPEQVVRYQIFQNKLFMDPDHYFRCLKKVFGHGHHNSHFVKDERKDLIFQYLKTNTPPLCEEIRELLRDEAKLIGL